MTSAPVAGAAFERYQQQRGGGGAAVANGNTVFKSGPLFISSKGIGWKSWKKRWFILTRTSLVFFKSDPLSLHSECSSYSNRQDVPRRTIPNPFNLQTEERGHLKEKQLEAQLLQKRMEEEKARVHKANPYPYTTDYPVMPPKPEPKPCTRAEGFQLESLVRHELEQQRLMEERQRMEREEAQKSIVKAQPVLKEDPIPLPEKERKPLTEVQKFVLHVDES